MQALKAHYVDLFIKDAVNLWFHFFDEDRIREEFVDFRGRLTAVDNNIPAKSRRLNRMLTRLTCARLQSLDLDAEEGKECREVICRLINLTFPVTEQTADRSTQTVNAELVHVGCQTERQGEAEDGAKRPVMAIVKPMDFAYSDTWGSESPQDIFDEDSSFGQHAQPPETDSDDSDL